MGKSFTNMNGESPKPEGLDEKYDATLLCAANGAPCLKGCTWINDSVCLKLEEKRKEAESLKTNSGLEEPYPREYLGGDTTVYDYG